MKLALKGHSISLCFSPFINLDPFLNHYILSSPGKFPRFQMALPPEQINIKRRREEEPVDTLCKKSSLTLGRPTAL
jgi:hypothetical protein